MSNAIPTNERLAQALEALGDPQLSNMIRKAREGYYDDFRSPLATPQVVLVAALRAAGHSDFARRVIDGEFDATPEEAEAWMVSAEGQAALKELMNHE